MAEQPMSIRSISRMGPSEDGQSAAFEFQTLDDRKFFFQCRTDALGHILIVLAGVYERANERRGHQPPSTGDTRISALKLIVGITPGVTEDGRAVLTFRTEANIETGYVLPAESLDQLESALQSAREALQGMKSPKKH